MKIGGSEAFYQYVHQFLSNIITAEEQWLTPDMSFFFANMIKWILSHLGKALYFSAIEAEKNSFNNSLF